MKITLNLAVAPTLRERYALGWAVPTTVLAFVVMVWLAHSTWVDVRQAREIESKVAEAEQREQKLTQREMELRRDFEQPDIRSLLEKTGFINGLIDKKRLSFTALAMKVAGLLPPDARLSGVALARSGDSSTVRFQVNGKAPQALETFLANLANSADFAEPVVTSEGFEQAQGGTSAAAGEVTVTCTARYVGAPTDAEAAATSDNASDQASDEASHQAEDKPSHPAGDKGSAGASDKVSGKTSDQTTAKKGGAVPNAK
ncbi:MAG TPA: hypothetical protein VG204_03535 [Terriglobia bacterium]|nr:hypothetical protein [Terriglobia bacterium]